MHFGAQCLLCPPLTIPLHFHAASALSLMSSYRQHKKLNSSQNPRACRTLWCCDLTRQRGRDTALRLVNNPTSPFTFLTPQSAHFRVGVWAFCIGIQHTLAPSSLLALPLCLVQQLVLH